MKGTVTIIITGGIGSGKSVVSRILRCNGHTVFDCDYEAKRLMNDDRDIKHALMSILGKEIYTQEGTLDRKKMGEIIFNDSKKRDFVNEIVHSAVRNEIKKTGLKIEGFFYIESAIPATGNLFQLTDRVWLVESPQEVRIQRVEKRDGLSKEEILKRIESQKYEMSQIEKMKPIIFENDNNHSILCKVLAYSDNFTINQTYLI